MVDREMIERVTDYAYECSGDDPGTGLCRDLLALCDLAEAALDARPATEWAEKYSADKHDILVADPLDEGYLPADISALAVRVSQLRALLSHLSPPTHQDEERA